MEQPLHAGLAALCCAALAACAGPGAPPRPPEAVQAETQQAEAARAKVVPGSRRADVQAALGKPIAVPFAGGWEVWVYRWGDAGHPDSATELVILFSPDGLVKKVRVRPGDAAPG